jgi:hypothetical protein
LRFGDRHQRGSVRRAGADEPRRSACRMLPRLASGVGGGSPARGEMRRCRPSCLPRGQDVCSLPHGPGADDLEVELDGPGRNERSHHGPGGGGPALRNGHPRVQRPRRGTRARGVRRPAWRPTPPSPDSSWLLAQWPYPSPSRRLCHRSASR